MDLKLFFKKIQIRNMQRVVNKEFDKNGLTDEVLDKQLEINHLRHSLDIPDGDNLIDDFVQ